MANPARKHSAGYEPPDEALDILRRLEPVLATLARDVSSVETRVQKVEDVVTRVEARVQKVEDVVARVEARVQKVEDVVARVDDRVRKLEADVARIDGRFGEFSARIDGRLGELSARIPTIWTIATLIFAIFGASFVLIRFASGH